MGDEGMKRFNNDDVLLLSRERRYSGFFKLDAVTVKHALYRGGMSDEILREVIVREDAVGVLLYDPELDSLLLIEQIRVPLIGESSTPWTIEIVAGLIEEGESPDEVAKRETQEEAGIELEQLIPIQNYFSSTGGSNERMHLFLGLCSLANAGGIYGVAAEGEEIRAFVLKRDEAFTLLERGMLDNASTLVAMLWFQIHYHRFKK